MSRPRKPKPKKPKPKSRSPKRPSPARPKAARAKPKHSPRKSQPAKQRRAAATGSYIAHKERTRRRQAELSTTGRDIGPIPPARNPRRRLAAGDSLRVFCESYFPHRFTRAWSPDHLRVIDRLERAFRDGGLFALAMPRGSGKSTLCEIACLWAASAGHQDFIVFVGASRATALDSMGSIQAEIEHNDLLVEDWPEVCTPIRKLEGISNRCKGQLCEGHRTHVGWRKEEIVLPTITGSKASGAIIRVAGITGRVRGLKFTRSDGRSVRPGAVIVDDPQTDRSARSASQCEQRERIIGGAILGLAGPGQKIAAVMPCTVVRHGDLADRFLDRNIYPAWQGERLKMVYAFPTHDKLWEQYGEIRRDELRNGGNGSQATAFYAEHRAEMDAGASIAWPERFNPDELSGVQHAMNLYLQDRNAFFAESQNEPLREDRDAGQLEALDIIARVNGLARGVAPLNTSQITAFIDVQQTLLYWLVAAWAPDFTGAVIDYGVHPQQGIKYFTLAEARTTLASLAPGAATEGAIYAGLTRLVDELLGRAWSREDKVPMHIGRLTIDAGYNTELVKGWCRTTAHAAIVLPSHGRYVGASSVPWSEYRKRPGEQLGYHWIVRVGENKTGRHVDVDTNYWKSFVAARLSTAIGDKGALTLYGPKNEDHRLIADHFCSEYRVKTEGRGRSLEEWKIRPERFDNHWWDCAVGCAAAASMLGCDLIGKTPAVKRTTSREDYEKRRSEFERRRGF